MNPNFADSALLLPLNLYGEKRRPLCWANKTCRASQDRVRAVEAARKLEITAQQHRTAVFCRLEF